MFKAWWNISTGGRCKFTTESAREKNLENRIIVGEVMAKSLVSCFLTHGVCLSCTFFDILTLICRNFRRSRDFDTYAVVHVRPVLSTNNLQTNFEMASYNERPKIKNRIT